MEYPSLEGFKNRLGKYLSEVIKLQQMRRSFAPLLLRSFCYTQCYKPNHISVFYTAVFYLTLKTMQ